jgi:hypothetical protein
MTLRCNLCGGLDLLLFSALLAGVNALGFVWLWVCKVLTRLDLPNLPRLAGRWLAQRQEKA